VFEVSGRFAHAEKLINATLPEYVKDGDA